MRQVLSMAPGKLEIKQDYSRIAVRVLPSLLANNMTNSSKSWSPVGRTLQFRGLLSLACSPPNPNTLTNSWISFELLFCLPARVSFGAIPLLWQTLPCPCFSFLLWRTLIAEHSPGPDFDEFLPFQGHRPPGPPLWRTLLCFLLLLYLTAPQALCPRTLANSRYFGELCILKRAVAI